MDKVNQPVVSVLSNRSLRFLVNGLVATAVNYGMLVLLIEYVGIRYTGVAALFSALVGISSSFIGNRLLFSGARHQS